MPQTNRRFLLLFLFLACCLVLAPASVYAKKPPPRKFTGSSVIGEAFGEPVRKELFLYHYKSALLFSRSASKEAEERTEESVRREAWHNLVFLRGAQEEGVKVPKDELESELKRLVSEKGVEYGTKNYEVWVITQVGDDVETFERRIRDLLAINKLLKLKGDAEVTVTEEEMAEKFSNQYNSFESEYIRFNTPKEADQFLEKLKNNRGLWKETFDEKVADGQKGAAWINIMSLEALIDLWKIPAEDAYKIHSLEPGEFTTAEFYYGDGVFRLLRRKEADPEKYDDEKKEYYQKMLTMVKKRAIAKEYFEGLFERAKPRDYIEEKKQADKVVEMQKKSLIAVETNKGTIKLRLFPEEAPMACENFIELVERGYYDGVIFHRVIKDFMIQGGDPTGTGTSGASIWDRPFADEVSDDVLFDRPWLLAMANSGPNTNMSQFFITTKPTPWLNKKHTIFGEVIEGTEVVKAIEASEVDSRDKPVEDQKILKAHILQEDKKNE